jgi:hypothetical protein
MEEQPDSTRDTHGEAGGEAGSSMVEYVGLGALSTLLVTGVAGALGSTVGDHLAAAIVHRLLEAISGSG